MLIAAISVLAVTVLIGLYLASLYILYEKPPKRLTLSGWLHAGSGAAGVTCLFLSLRSPAHGVARGAGSFGWIAAIMLAATLAGGLLILLLHLRRRGMSPLLIALHGMLGVAGYVMLAAYFSSKASMGH